MAVSKRNTIHLVSRRHNRTVADLRIQLEVAELMISMLCWVKPTPQQLLTRSQRLRLADVSRRAGLSHEAMVRRAVGNWLAIEAPVYLQQYDA